MSLIQDPAGFGDANVVDANTPTFTAKKAVAVVTAPGSVSPTSTQLPASLGQKAMAASLPVVIASDQTAVPTSNATQLPAALGPAAKAAALPVTMATDQPAISTSNATQLPAALGQVAMAASLPVVIANNQTAVPTSNATQLPAALGQVAMAASLPVAIANNQSTLPVKEVIAGTSAVTNVAAAVADTSLLASNANRLSAVVTNDSTSVLYLKYGTGASATSYSYKLAAGAIWEMPAQRYTGAINGFWVAANGAARVTEITQ